MTTIGKREVLELRAEVVRGIRRFFEGRGYLEVDTPIRVKTPALEDHIDAEPSGEKWLRTSPELHMKRMVCDGYEKIFQIGPCFRQGERGMHHLPEYTMLEWYQVGVDSSVILIETLDLLRSVAQKVKKPSTGGLEQEPIMVTISGVFSQVAGWDPIKSFDSDRFDLDLIEKVEPWIEKQKSPIVVKDFPVERAALARIKQDDRPVADRWELYVGGVELANCYTELTDPSEQRRRFQECAKLRKKDGRPVYPLDERFLQAMDQKMPDCAGIALGVDRLIMLFAELDDISQVVAFSE